jgi:hypothetical protein
VLYSNRLRGAGKRLGQISPFAGNKRITTHEDVKEGFGFTKS